MGGPDKNIVVNYNISNPEEVIKRSLDLIGREESISESKWQVFRRKKYLFPQKPHKKIKNVKELKVLWYYLP